MIIFHFLEVILTANTGEWKADGKLRCIVQITFNDLPKLIMKENYFND